MTPSQPPTNTEPVPEHYITLDVDVSGDLEARWVYDAEQDTVGVLLRHLD